MLTPIGTKTFKPEIAFGNPTARNGHTLIRMTAFSYRAGEAGSDNRFSLKDAVFKDNAGVDISPTIENIQFSSGGVVTVTDNNVPIQFYQSSDSNRNWIEWAVTGGNVQIGSYVLTAAPEIAGDTRNLYQWKIETLGEHDSRWHVLDIKDLGTSDKTAFVSKISGHDISLAVDPFGDTSSTDGFTPIVNYVGKAPLKPTSVRATANSKSEILIKWSAGSVLVQSDSVLTY